MVTQYDDTYSNPSADIQNLVANKVNVLDEYVLFQSGQYEYTALIRNVVTNDVKHIVFNRTNTSGYSNYYTVSIEENQTFDYNVSNEYYCYSNVGIGKALDLPIYKSTVSISLIIITCVLGFAIMFKGAIYRCLKRR